MKMRGARCILSIVISVIAVALYQLAAAASPEDSARPVRLRFAWNSGMRAAIHMTLTQRKPEPAVVAQYRATLVASRQGSNLRLSFIDPTVTADVSGGMERYDQTLEELRFLSVLDFLVSPQGKFVGLVPDQHIQSALKDTFGAVKVLTPDTIDRLANRFAEPRARTMWSDWVSLWLGAGLSLQTAYEMKRKVATILPGAPLSATSQLQVVRQERCERGNRIRVCAVISITDAPDPDALAAWREQIIGNLPPESREEARSEYRSITMNLSNETQYILEPDGIIPHALTVTRMATISGIRNGEPETEQDVWELKCEFEYQD